MAVEVIVHPSPRDLLVALRDVPGADSRETATAIGYLYGLATATTSAATPTTGAEEPRPDADTQLVVSLRDDGDFRLLFTKLDWSQCKIVSPVAPSQLAELALPFVPTLRERLLTLAPLNTKPELLRGITGPQILVDALLDGWPHPRIAKPSMYILPASCAVPPPTPILPAEHTLSRIRDFSQLPSDEEDAIADLVRGFWGDHVTAPKLDRAGRIAYVANMATAEALWVYRAPPKSEQASSTTVPVGFVYTGRPTSHTCAIRGVYVDPAYRSSGIGTRMVSFVVHAHLVTATHRPIDWKRPLDEQHLVDDETKWGRKDEVCLFVEPENKGARQAYERVGFKISETLWCDVDLEGVEKGHW